MQLSQMPDCFTLSKEYERMKRLTLLPIIIFLLLISNSTCSTVSKTRNLELVRKKNVIKSNYYAIVIGINRYEDENIPVLDNCNSKEPN